MGETYPFQLRKFELVASNRNFRKLRLALDVGRVRLDVMALGLESRMFVLLLEEAVERIGKMLPPFKGNIPESPKFDKNIG
ncbi:Hypothetical protein Eab7_1246 [Exiguobacterium antarcticum B7]|nr:Hypothetical protein Eab7_1246 [Exiguobacterium antarcticum B7]